MTYRLVRCEGSGQPVSLTLTGSGICPVCRKQVNATSKNLAHEHKRHEFDGVP